MTVVSAVSPTTFPANEHGLDRAASALRVRAFGAGPGRDLKAFEKITRANATGTPTSVLSGRSVPISNVEE